MQEKWSNVHVGRFGVGTSVDLSKVGNLTMFQGNKVPAFSSVQARRYRLSPHGMDKSQSRIGNVRYKGLSRLTDPFLYLHLLLATDLIYSRPLDLPVIMWPTYAANFVNGSPSCWLLGLSILDVKKWAIETSKP